MLVGRKMYQTFEVVVDADDGPFQTAIDAAYDAPENAWDDDRAECYEVYACVDENDKVHYIDFNKPMPKLTVSLNAWEEDD